MGLDMYLSKKTYVKNWDFMKPEDLHTVSVLRNNEPVPYIQPHRVSYIMESVMYWRKSNQIHNWFVNNVQDGKDDCGEYYVSVDQLKELLGVCKNVLEHIEKSEKTKQMVEVGWSDGKPMMEEVEVYVSPEIEELLPTTDGFFFGSTEYDEYYVSDIKSTITELETILSEDNTNGEFYYSSSW
jgi:hypothetical protein